MIMIFSSSYSTAFGDDTRSRPHGRGWNEHPSSHPPPLLFDPRLSSPLLSSPFLSTPAWAPGKSHPRGPHFQFFSKVASETRTEEEQNIEKSCGQVLISLPFDLFPTPPPPIPLCERVEWVWPMLHTSRPDIPPGRKIVQRT